MSTAGDELELVDGPRNEQPLTLTYQFPNGGKAVEVHLAPPTEDFFKNTKPGDVMVLDVLSVREHVTRERRAGTAPKKTSRKR